MSREYTFSFLRNQSREFILLFFYYPYQIRNMITVIIFSIIFYISNIVNLIPTFTGPPTISQPIDTISIDPHSLPILLYKPILHLTNTSTSMTISNNTTPTNNSCLSNPFHSKPCHLNLFSNPSNQIRNMITLIIFSFIFYISNVVHLFSTIAEPSANFQYLDNISIGLHLLSILFLYKSILHLIYASFTLSSTHFTIHSRFIYKFIFTLLRTSHLFVLYQANLFICYQALHVRLYAFSHTVSQIYIFLHLCEPIHIYIYSHSKVSNKSDYSTSSYRFIVMLQIIIIMIMCYIPSFNTNNNCVSILEISSSMDDIVYGTNTTKQSIANEFIYVIINFQIPLDDRNIQHLPSLPNFTLIPINIISTPSLTHYQMHIYHLNRICNHHFYRIFSLVFYNAIMRLIIMALLQQINNILSRGVLFKILQHPNITILNNLTYHCSNLLFSFERIELISCLVYYSYYEYVSLQELLQLLTISIKSISTPI